MQHRKGRKRGEGGGLPCKEGRGGLVASLVLCFRLRAAEGDRRLLASQPPNGKGENFLHNDQTVVCNNTRHGGMGMDWKNL